MAMATTLFFMVALLPSVAPAFCPDGKLEEADITQVLDSINSIRGDVTSGVTASLPPGKNMNKLEWDCGLEKEAIDAVDGSCAVVKQPTDKAWMMIYEFDDLMTISEVIDPVLHNLLADDVYTPKAVGTSAVTYVPDIIGTPVDDAFNFIRASATKVACARTDCGGGDIAVFCLTDQKKLEPNDVIYYFGSGLCTSDGDCDSGRSCDSGLCIEAVPTTTPPATTQATTQAPTQAPTQASTQAPTQAQATTQAATTTAPSYPGELPSGTNTLCKMHDGMTDELRMHFLDTQNYRRSLITLGQQQRPSGNYLPKGGDMLKLKLDCDLEKAAIEEVRTCPSSKKADSVYGKNFDMFAQSSATGTYRDAIKKAVTNWWKVVRNDNTGPGMQVTFRSSHVGTAIETYTQIAWSRTNFLGCAIAKCSSSYTVICLYKPKGNIPEQVLYKIGNPCSACPTGTKCDASLGLCVN